MLTNPILDAPAVREARGRFLKALWNELQSAEYNGTSDAALDAYAAAILAEVKRRVEALEPVAWIDYNAGSDRRPSLDRAAVLRVLDGRDDA